VRLPTLTYANNGQTMAWSPDNKKAALVANDNKGPVRLFVSAMPAPSWRQVAAFAFIDQPAWSGDGNWISFRVQDLNGGEDYYVVHPDGSGLKNVTATANLPAADRPYNVDGWISNYLIVHSGNPDQTAKVYLLRADDGLVKTLIDSASTNIEYSPSPDGSLLAYDDYPGNNTVNALRVVAPDGSGMLKLASFKTPIRPITWSPDASTLAFAVDGSGVYTINRDGRGLEQVYSQAQILNLAFSPNGQFLLVETDNPAGLFVVDLSSLQTHLLQAPGLSLTDWWREPAWVP
jgi:Tol biopolymer transport system component